MGITYGSGSQTCSSSTYGVGYPVLFTDEAGNQRRTFTDALGRTIEVDELNSGSLYANACYSYDVLGDLTGVAQGSQTRTYTHDMLSRLTSTTTPEAGTVTDSYAVTGNPCSGNPSFPCGRTDNRSITTTYAYDALNRLASKTYSDWTPRENFFYGDHLPTSWPAWTGVSFTNAKARLALACTNSASGTCTSPQTAVAFSYDPMGRPLYYWQCTPYNCGKPSIWSVQDTYDKAGDVATWTHPWPFTITNTINAAQQITQIQNTTWSDSTIHPQNIAQSMSYTALGTPAAWRTAAWAAVV